MTLRTVSAALLLAALPVAAEPLNYNVVEFSESAVTEVARDTMTARFQVTAEGKDRTAVNAAFTRKFNAFSRKAQGKPFQTELTGRSANPRYQYNNGKRTQTGWIETAEFKVESQDFAALNRLIAETQNDANLEHSSFSVSKAKREAAIDEVSKAALLRFKDRAQSLAGTLGFSGYKIVKLNLGHIGSRTIGYDSYQMKMSRAAPMMASAGMAADAEAAPVLPGSEEISITVEGAIQM
ncbi:SIMPL domain-containing protein [Bergeriella denitrificans]|uniref:Predicted periplasmic/secreted protein n=1 Tax=Bergeriella denitrificans TaxID=494 RepID=A0A378UGK5_BERDE|nr:SIMPL domain-containing protein [Bergeriella denitrificans]STZ76518.1 Predicted periplasmic/secreted protein [Bergeriella denitrificans]